MFSLKRRIEEIDSQDAAFRCALECYLASITAVREHAVDLDPEITRDHQLALRSLHRAIFDDPTPASLKRSRDELANLLEKYRARTKSWAAEREEVVRSMILTLAEASEKMLAHNTVHSAHLQKFTGELQKTARLPDILQVKRNLDRQVEVLRLTVTRMTNDGQSCVSHLETKLNEIQERLLRAERRASTDSLTGLLNRGEAEACLQAQLDSACRPCILLIDLDGFKQVNDRWGHQCGDQILKTFSRNLERVVRPGDMVCRWGGDEFIVLLKSGDNIEKERVRHIQANLRAWYKVVAAGKTVEVEIGASVGFAEASEGESLDELVCKADRNMYEQKGITTVCVPQ